MGNELQLTITYYPLPKAPDFVPHESRKRYISSRNKQPQ